MDPPMPPPPPPVQTWPEMPPEAQEERKKIPGVLLIVGGLLGVINSISLITGGQRMVEYMGQGENLSYILLILGAVFLIFSILGLLSGVLHLLKGPKPYVRAMAIFGVLAVGPLLLTTILSAIALLLMKEKRVYVMPEEGF